MINSSIAEAYFIAAMMVLILILSAAASVFLCGSIKRKRGKIL
jgi:hypothetical protein